MSVAQNYKNHMRLDPRFHFFAMPVLLLNLVVAIIVAARYWPLLHWLGVWIVVVAIALIMTAGLLRDYGLKNQDRLIRLEERVRYASLLSPAELATSRNLSNRQIIALRFASDAELPPLIVRTVSEGFSPKQIKESIQIWRADESRI